MAAGGGGQHAAVAEHQGIELGFQLPKLGPLLRQLAVEPLVLRVGGELVGGVAEEVAHQGVQTVVLAHVAGKVGTTAATLACAVPEPTRRLPAARLPWLDVAVIAATHHMRE